MKLWQLDSVLGGNRTLPQKLASSRTEWKPLGELFAKVGELRKTGDWNTLSQPLPHDFVRQVLVASGLKCYVSRGGLLLSRSTSHEQVPMPAEQVFEKYGGDVLEAVYERGAVDVSGSHDRTKPG
jgi:hypothetical protein